MAQGSFESPLERLSELPLVSICIPAYNAERFIRETLESALAQDYPNLEIIVSDDASTDRTPEIVAAYENNGVRLIRQAKNLGMTPNMNAAIRASQGKYAVKLDADDILEPNYVSSLVPIMEAHPRVAFAHCACRLIDKDGKFLGFERSIHGSFRRSGLEEWPRYVFGPRAVHILMLRRTAFEEVGGYDQSFLRSQDWKLERDLLKVGDVYYCDEVLAQYQSHGEGKAGLGPLRARAFLQHLEDMDRNWPSQVPNKGPLLLRARRRMAITVVIQAIYVEKADSEAMMRVMPQFGNFWLPNLLARIILAGGSKILHRLYQYELLLRQWAKNLLYKKSSPNLGAH